MNEMETKEIHEIRTEVKCLSERVSAIDARMSAVEARLTEMSQRINWLFGLQVVVIGAIFADIFAK